MLECSYLNALDSQPVGLKERLTIFDLLKELKFDPSKIYDIGLDQSSSCTGLCVVSSDMSHIVMAELASNGLAYEYYKRQLFTVLKGLLENLPIRYFIMEDPLKYSSRSQNPKLVDLKNSILEFINEGKHGFNFEHFAKIQPQSWRAGLLGSVTEFFENGDGEPISLRKTSKRATAFTLMRQFPVTKHFLKVCHNPTESSGYVAYDALGIVVGYRARFAVREDSNITKIQGSKTSLSSSYGIFFDCSTQTGNNEFSLVINFLSTEGNLGKPRLKFYNEEETIYNNVKMAIASADGVNARERFVVSKVTDPLVVVQLCALFGWKNSRSENVYMIVIPIKKIKKVVTSLVEECTDFIKVY